MRGPLLERMPPFERSRLRVSQEAAAASAAASDTPVANGVGAHTNGGEAPAPPTDSSALLDLLGVMDDTPVPAVSKPAPAMNSDILDLLGGLDSSPPAKPPTDITPSPLGGDSTNILDGLLSAPATNLSVSTNNVINSGSLVDSTSARTSECN